MTAATSQPPASIAPMPARRRYGIATASSVACHFFVLLLIGLLSGRTPVRPDILIPIELTMAEAAADSLVLGPGGHPEAPQKTTPAPAASPKPSKQQPSSQGKAAASAPAPSKLLTSESGTEPAGPEGVGDEAAGPGGEEEAPAGPTRGPDIVGGPRPIYPKDALDQGLEGRVTLSVLVAADGAVSSVTVEKSSGHPILDRVAVRAVEGNWSFQPGLENGKPVSGKCAITFAFFNAKVERE